MHSCLSLIYATENLKACPHLNLGNGSYYQPADRGVCDVLASCPSHEMKTLYIQSRVSKQSSASCNKLVRCRQAWRRPCLGMWRFSRRLAHFCWRSALSSCQNKNAEEIVAYAAHVPPKRLKDHTS